jgi:glycosyltransferase involved in cell wall biosynthesis
MKVSSSITLSIVTPVYAGAPYLEKLVAHLAKVREHWLAKNAPMELLEAIFVDDLAIDNSPQILDTLATQYSWVRVIHLSSNFGQHPATIAGILHSSGDWIVTLDEDLQHPPDRIEDMLRKVAETHCDIVYANAIGDVHESWWRDWGSRFYKQFVAILTGNQNIRYFNSFRLLRGNIGRAAASICSHETYFDIALSWFTQRIEPLLMPLKDHRFIGKSQSGYNFHKLLSHSRRLLLTTHTKILRLGALIGGLTVIMSVLYSSYVLLKMLFYPETIPVRGWTSLVMLISFFGGLITFLLGILLEYLAVVLLHIQGKPTFFVVDRNLDAILIEYFREH